MAPDLDELFSPWVDALGKDYPGYRNHVERLLGICELLAGDAWKGMDPMAFRVAAVYHDIGIWSDRTFDYLAPSSTRAEAYLRQHGHEALVPVVDAMIQQHHKLRPAGSAHDPVEIFRRADWVDVTLGLLHFTISRADYRALLRRHPDAGFHWNLVKLTGRRALTNPLSPLPMFRW
ncbi:MAG: metal dependent phosphohydrolase [Moraxellaceae bacterium]|jgi:hypothetical protein|nr:metal dependent phosphohydrolase [Moraxellaceae bacterium]